MKNILNMLPYQWQRELLTKIIELHKQNPNKKIIVLNLPYRGGKVYFQKVLNEVTKDA